MDREKLLSVILKTIMESFRLDKTGILLRFFDLMGCEEKARVDDKSQESLILWRSRPIQLTSFSSDKLDNEGDLFR